LIVTYFRSSSYNQWDACPFKYLLIYVLGHREPPGKAAEKGTIFHKVMECLAAYKRAKQLGTLGGVVSDHELGPLPVQWFERDLYQLFERSFSHYVNNSPNKHTLTDKSDVWKWLQKALAENNGQFDPRKQNIFCPEQSFDMTIDREWADYSYLWQGQRVEGKLAIKGTIDLITKVNDTTLEVLDYKTGKRSDFATGKEKTLAYLYGDAQLRLYHYAVSRLFPEIENVIVSIYFVNYGGCFTVCWDKSEMADTEEILKKRFFEIRNNVKPRRLSNNHKDWRCKNICSFCKTSFESDTMNKCNRIYKDLEENGLKYVVDKYTVPGHSPHYYQAPGSTGIPVTKED
jgi:hypothetical protein